MTEPTTTMFSELPLGAIFTMRSVPAYWGERFQKLSDYDYVRISQDGTRIPPTYPVESAKHQTVEIVIASAKAETPPIEQRHWFPHVGDECPLEKSTNLEFQVAYQDETVSDWMSCAYPQKQDWRQECHDGVVKHYRLRRQGDDKPSVFTSLTQSAKVHKILMAHFAAESTPTSPAADSSNETFLPFLVLENISDLNADPEHGVLFEGTATEFCNEEIDWTPTEDVMAEMRAIGTNYVMCSSEEREAALTLAQDAARYLPGDHKYTKDVDSNWTPHEWILAALVTARKKGYAEGARAAADLNSSKPTESPAAEPESQSEIDPSGVKTLAIVKEIMTALADLKMMNTHSVTIKNKIDLNGRFGRYGTMGYAVPAEAVEQKPFDPARFNIDTAKPVAHACVERTSDSIRYYAKLTLEGHKMPEGAPMYAYPLDHPGLGKPE